MPPSGTGRAGGGAHHQQDEGPPVGASPFPPGPHRRLGRPEPKARARTAGPSPVLVAAVVALATLLSAPPARSADTASPHPPMATLGDLPLVEVRAAHPGSTFAVIVSGDGGWARIDRSVADALAGRGIPSVGLDSLRYFWRRRTPDAAGRDLERILDHYFEAWRMKRVILVGYSRGADVLPFMATRLRPDQVRRTALIALLGVRHAIDFEIRVRDFLPATAAAGTHPVKPEIDKLAGRKVLCVYGADDTDSLCPELDRQRVTVVVTRGGHHFGGDYRMLADRIVREAR